MNKDRLRTVDFVADYNIATRYGLHKDATYGGYLLGIWTLCNEDGIDVPTALVELFNTGNIVYVCADRLTFNDRPKQYETVEVVLSEKQAQDMMNLLDGYASALTRDDISDLTFGMQDKFIDTTTTDLIMFANDMSQKINDSFE